MKLFKLIILFSIVVLLIIAIAIKIPINSNKSFVKIDGKTFFVDVAKTDRQKELGLSVYENLENDKGMVFPFEKPDKYNFWMKGMKFPIDIIYINNNKIIDIFQNLPIPINQFQPTIVSPSAKTNFVLEINAGLSEKYKFKKGDFVEIKL